MARLVRRVPTVAGLTGQCWAAGTDRPIGPQGPTGAQGAVGTPGADGAQGATGAQGPQGPRTSAATKAYQASAKPSSYAADATASAIVYCPPGDIAVGGGASIDGASLTQDVYLDHSMPVFAGGATTVGGAQPTGWMAKAVQNTGGSTQWSVYAPMSSV